MSRADWLRTFLAVYRSGSMTQGAQARGISQPAASQQIAALSKAVGSPVFTRTRDGVTSTSRGRELYAEVAESLDRLEGILVDLDGGRISTGSAPTRIGSSGDLLDGFILPRVSAGPSHVSATFGDETDLFTRLASGEVDLTVTLTPPNRRTLFETHVVGQRNFLLVAAAADAPPRPLSEPADVAEWLTGRPWVSYSHELPHTRRFWDARLGKPFDAQIRLVAPDLRSVVTAVKLGMGVSLVPDYACRRELAEGSVAQACDVTGLFADEPVYASLRRVDTAHLGVREALHQLKTELP